MARPERKTVDYFPHYISDGKKMFYIEQKYGNDGYATWFKILESLANTNDHFLNLNNEMDVLFLSAKCRVEKTVLIDILNDLCVFGEIDNFLWLNKLVYSKKFIESIQDAYYRRSNKCMTYEGFCIHYEGLCTTITPIEYEKQYNNPQSKVKYTKVNQSKEDDTPPTPKGEVIDFDVLLKFINDKFSRKFVTINEKVKRQYNGLLKQGYIKQNITDAIINCQKSEFHKGNNYQYCTPGYFARTETIDKWGAKTEQSKPTFKTAYIIHDHD